MRKIFIYILLFFFPLNSCITIEDDPFVTLSPAIEFRGYILKDDVIVNTTVNAVPTFVNPGNIPTIYEYEGEVSFYNELTGELLSSSQISGDGLTTIIKSQVTTDRYEDIIIEASGAVSAYADKESDGIRSNDILLHKADFYEVISLSDVINLENYPVVILAPTVNFQSHIRNKELYITATVSANPVYQFTTSYPILFTHDGVIQVYDQNSGALLRSSPLDGEGLIATETVLQDTASYDGFVVVASGSINCTGDIGSDGNKSNDIQIATAEFNQTLQIDLVEE